MGRRGGPGVPFILSKIVEWEYHWVLKFVFVVGKCSKIFSSGFCRKAQVKCKPFLVTKSGVMVLGIPSVDRGNWGWECNSLCYHVLALHEKHNLQKYAVFCAERFEKNHALHVHLTYNWWQLFLELVGPQIILLDSLSNKQSSYSFSRDNNWAMH